MWRKMNRTLNCLEQMVDEALAGTFCEKDYNETRLSRLETKWMHFLGTSALDRTRLEQEKENVKSLVSDISHQIKTPMTNIKLYVSLLEEAMQNEQQMQCRQDKLELLEEITRQANKLEFFIQALTKISRLESNLVEVVPEKMDIALLLDRAIAEVRPGAKQKQITIVNTYKGSSQAYFDLKWTKEALVNVLDNAVKYSPPGADVILSVQQYQMYMMISVKDEGIGICEEDLPKIFSRFYRAPEVRQEEGVGIGLYLTREILKKEHGYIKVHSRVGEGAEFLLYLYRHKV